MWYLSKNIINRPIHKFVKEFTVNVLCAVGLIFVIGKHMAISTDNFINLVLDAVVVSAIVFISLAVVNVLLNINLFIRKKTSE